MKQVTIALGLAAALLAAGPIQAGEGITYTDRAAFAAALKGGGTCIDFDEPRSVYQMDILAYPDQGVQFRSSFDVEPSYLRVLTPDDFPVPSNILIADRSHHSLDAQFDSPVGAFGADLYSLFGNTVVITLHFTDGATASHTAFTDGDGSVFFGFVGTADTLSKISFSNVSTGFVGIDDFCFGTLPADGDPGSGVTLADLLEAIVAGLADGSIRRIGRSLLAKVHAAEAALEADRPQVAEAALLALREQVRAQSGKQIDAALASDLVEMIEACLQSLE
jgi:hypothetical protein